MSRQIYGYTEPFLAENDHYVRFLCVTVEDQGGVMVSVRNELGVYNNLLLPPDEARDLAAALRTAMNPTER